MKKIHTKKRTGLQLWLRDTFFASTLRMLAAHRDSRLLCEVREEGFETPEPTPGQIEDFLFI